MCTAKKPNDGEFPHVENRPGRLPTVLLPGGRRRRVSGHCRPRAGGSDCGGPPPSEGSLKRTGSPPKPRPRLPGPHQAVGSGRWRACPARCHPRSPRGRALPPAQKGPWGRPAPLLPCPWILRSGSNPRAGSAPRGGVLHWLLRLGQVWSR